jgi:hypothetical protein
MKSAPYSHTTPVPGKSHEADVTLGEGLAMGKKKHGAHDKVRSVKHDMDAQPRALADHMRIVDGGADPMGGCKK